LGNAITHDRGRWPGGTWRNIVPAVAATSAKQQTTMRPNNMQTENDLLLFISVSPCRRGGSGRRHSISVFRGRFKVCPNNLIVPLFTGNRHFHGPPLHHAPVNDGRVLASSFHEFEVHICPRQPLPRSKQPAYRCSLNSRATERTPQHRNFSSCLLISADSHGDCMMSLAKRSESIGIPFAAKDVIE
jgi:hypothetical protein